MRRRLEQTATSGCSFGAGAHDAILAAVGIRISIYELSAVNSALSIRYFAALSAAAPCRALPSRGDNKIGLLVDSLARKLHSRL